MRILISGGGIAGPVAAYWLAKAGSHEIIVLEKATELLAQGQNIDINGSARKVIKRMGLTSQVKAKNTTEAGTRFISPNGKPYAEFPLVEGSSLSVTNEFEILRGDLAVILYEASKDLPGVTYRFGTFIKEVISNTEGSVRVELNDGQVEEFDVLVVADGQWSQVRKAVFDPAELTVVDKHAYIAYFTAPKTEYDDNWLNVYSAVNSRVISIRPDPYETIRANLTIMPLTAGQEAEYYAAIRAGKEVQRDLLFRDFSDAGWESQRLLSTIDAAQDFYFQGLQQIRMANWSKNRVVLLGDTAHAPTGLTGMGTSLAITGAYLLAGEVSKLQPSEDPSVAFKEYEHIFKPFVEKIQNVPFFIPSIAHAQHAWKIYLLQWLIYIVAKIIAIPLVQKLISKAKGGEEKEDFKLPVYPVFEGEHYF